MLWAFEKKLIVIDIINIIGIPTYVMCASGKFSTRCLVVSIFETGNCINFDQNGSSKKITPLCSIICHLEEYIIRV